MNAPLVGSRLRPADHLYRAATAEILASRRRISAAEVLRTNWPEDRVSKLVTRAASLPASLGTANWAANLAQAAVGDFIVGLAPQSAAAALIAESLRISLAGRGSISIPGRIMLAADAGGFVAEGAPLPVKALTMFSGPTLSPSKFGTIVAFTQEMMDASPTDFDTIVKQMLAEAAAVALDAALFSNTAASSMRPAGILNGISALTPTAGGGQNALAKDIELLVAALAAAGGGKQIVFVASPPQAASLKLFAGFRFDYPILASAALATGTVVAVDPASFASAFDAEPRFEVADGPVLHQEDAAPAAIGTTGTPNVVAAPSRSLWQTDCLALRMVLRTAWGLRASGHTQWITSVTW